MGNIQDLNKFIPLSRPYLTDEDIKNVNRTILSGFLVQGKEVESIEVKIAKYTNTNHAIAVSSATAGLHLALLSLGVGLNDEVIVPAFSFVATANAVELVGAKPIFVDIDLSNFNIDVNEIEKAITPRTKAIIPVHEFGLTCNIEQIINIAKANKIHVIEDCACAIGAHKKDKHVGTFGDVGIFSFHPRKTITSGEGGMIITNNENVAKYIKSIRNHGIDLNGSSLNFVYAGYNYRMTDIQASLLKGQLDNLNLFIEDRKKLAKCYLENITNNRIILPKDNQHEEHTWQTFHVITDLPSTKRDDVIKILKEKGIGSNMGAQCIPAQYYYREKYNYDCNLNFPNALKAYNNGLALPMFYGLTLSEIKYISNVLNTIK